MIKIKTYQDFIEAVVQGEDEKKNFLLSAIKDHKAQDEYKTACDAVLYGEGKNATIKKYQKVLYKLSGEAVPDTYTANHRCASGFFNRFVTQQTSYEMGNGISFAKKETKTKLGKNIDTVLYRGIKSALVQGVSFGYYNFDHLEFFNLTEFVPLYDEENGALRAGIRFWQLEDRKPLRVTLYEEDGVTHYLKESGGDLVEYIPKRDHKSLIVRSKIDGERIYNNGNYPTFPIIPLWGNIRKQSELIGIREQIDCYDLIKSGFANDLDDASIIYWTLQNAGGMDDDITLAKFVERMKTLRAAVTGDDVKVESHTMDVPYEGRETYLNRLERDLYRDYMALDVDSIASGRTVTATQIEAAYEPLNEKADELEMCLCEFFEGIFSVMGVDDVPTFNRSQISNRSEQVETIMSVSTVIGEEETVRQVCATLGISDRFDEIWRQKIEEDADRYNQMQQEVELLKQRQGIGGNAMEE